MGIKLLLIFAVVGLIVTTHANPFHSDVAKGLNFVCKFCCLINPEGDCCSTCTDFEEKKDEEKPTEIATEMESLEKVADLAEYQSQRKTIIQSDINLLCLCCKNSHFSYCCQRCPLADPRAQSVLSGTCNSFTREKLNEGYERCVYKDSLGIPTIGIGFNLHRSGAKGAISAVGANYDKLLSGSQCLTDSQIQQLFNRDMATAVSCAQSFVGSNWYRLGETRQSAVADMAFNLGCPRLHQFRRFRAALQSSPPNYRAAVREMKDSRWCRQVGYRCGRNVACMSSS